MDVFNGEAREHGQPAAHVVAVGVEALGLARVVQHVAEGVRVCGARGPEQGASATVLPS